ncbi:MAG: DUF2029 domain-containing protein [Candidatus Kerfeldbacteria bacterium]|nr:DUF2029 domain-containing protein [Candidatus Kerfeldbacteria bacterium]
MITLEAILLFISGWGSGTLLENHYGDPFIVGTGRILIIPLLGLVGFILYVFSGAGKKQSRERTRFFIAAATTLAILLTIVSQQVSIRVHGQKGFGKNDGAVQTEEAARFFLHGINPYTAQYHNTSFRYFFSRDTPNGDHVADTHYAYLPTVFLLDVPGVWLKDHLGAPVDFQTISVIALLGLSTLLIWSVKSWTTRTQVLLLTIGNPFIWVFPISGFNDMIYLCFLVGAVVATIHKRWVWAGLAFGLTVATKQTAWATIPFLFWWWWWYKRQFPQETKGLKQMVAYALVTAGIFLVPFIIWSPYNFYDDAVRYVAGVIPWSYPISGVTFLQYLRIWRLIPSPWTVIPAAPFQLFAATPVLLLGAKFIRRKPSIENWLSVSTILVLVLTLFNRFGPGNYYSAVLTMAIASYVLGYLRPKEKNEAEKKYGHGVRPAQK